MAQPPSCLAFVLWTFNNKFEINRSLVMRLLATGLIVLLTSCTLAAHAQKAFAEDDVSQSSISINRSALAGSSLLLQFDAPSNAKLGGTIKINGKVAANLGSTRSVSLAGCMRSGCEIDVAATYQPDSAVSMVIYSTNGALRNQQQSSGSGVLNQKFTLNIN
jgi:hypothetical protein